MVRVWHLSPTVLDQRRLTGEHVENHIIVNVLLRMYAVAKEQGCQVQEVDWTGIKIGWRSHPQVTRWIGRVGALIQRHDDLVQEMNFRKWERDGRPTPLIYTDHNSDMEEQLEKLRELDPNDDSYGHFYQYCDPDRKLLDLRHLFEKWEKDKAAGRPPKGHDDIAAYHQLALLAGDLETAEKMLMEKLLT